MVAGLGTNLTMSLRFQSGIKTRTIDGHEVSFERRRYGTQFYTWAYVKINNGWISLGDPWPCVHPKNNELAKAIKSLTLTA